MVVATFHSTKHQIGLWRHLRYLLEFGVVFPVAKAVVPLLETMYRNNRPQFADHIDHLTTRDDIGSQRVSRASKMLSRKASSGGTTGIPTTIYEYFWVTVLERMYILYLWSLVGWKPTHRTVVFRGNRISSPTERRGRMLVVSSYRMTRDAGRIAAEVAAFRPQWVWAYPSVFFSFQRIIDAQFKFDDLIGFLFGSEKIYNWQRDELAEKYQEARMLDWYGSSEKVALAYRIYPDQDFTLVRSYSKVLLKPINSEDAWPRSCALVGSSYFQSPTRIHNYHVGDIVIANPDGTIIDILGREQDFIFLKDGKPAPFSQIVGSIHTDLWEGIRRFRFEQEHVGELEVYLEEMRPGGCATLREQFEALIAAALGGTVELRFHFGQIEPRRSSAGKEIYFVQRLGSAISVAD
jgi:phenylacetate-coenzyme A ligase PaaK-like adenylate-forming protein